MNKKIITFSTVLILTGLLILNSRIASAEGCCFLDYTEMCYYGTSSECTNEEGMFFDGYDCNNIDKCEIGCCCEGPLNRDPYPMLRGVCDDTFNGLFLNYVNNFERCSNICGQTPLCEGSCQFNSNNCMGESKEVAAGQYYCWENNLTYPTQENCIKWCPKIDKCELGKQITKNCYCETILRSSGYCCWDNIYSSDTSGGTCVTGNDCEKHKYSLTGDYFECCDSCAGDLSDPSKHWESGDTICTNNYGIGRSKCCSQCISGNFTLPTVGGACDEITPPAVRPLRARAIKGTKAVNLTWDNPCPIPSKVVSYSVWREPNHYLGTFTTGDTSFIDYDVKWSNEVSSTTYTYFIKANYLSGRSSLQTSASITMGHYACEGIFNDKEFCLNNILTKTGELTNGYRCDEDNLLEEKQVCSSNYVCFGPDANGLTSCREKTNCKEGGNPFGLYYTEQECASDDKYCYYDYSDTIIDDCKDCGSISDCYGYRSESACSKDNCLITGMHVAEIDHPCEWYSTFGEFGKGICYDTDYYGTEYCGLCSKNSTAFNNLNCDQEICAKLGSCYSNGLSCEPCRTGNITCGNYDNEYSCVNSHLLGKREFNISGCKITKSDDACSLGACKWGDPTLTGKKICYKDANDDNVADCAKGETRCNDFEPFDTIPQVDIPKINSNGYGITFYLTGGGSGDLKAFYFCIDQDNSCCPAKSLRVNPSTREVVINPINESNITAQVETYFIRYYSIDSNNNFEEVKSTEFFADPVKPQLSLDYYTYGEGEHYYTVIILVSDEYVDCDYRLNNLPNEKLKDMNFKSGFNNTFFARFLDLGEGGYQFTAACKDMAGNLEEKTISINVMDMSPPPLTLYREPPSIVYKQAYALRGFTEPDLPIAIDIFDANWDNPLSYYSSSGAESLPKQGFSGMSMQDLFYGSYPRINNTLIQIRGDWSAVLSAGNYLEFSSNLRAPRYKISSLNVIGFGAGSRFTKINLDSPLEVDVTGADKVSAFTSAYPSGWFEIPLIFKEGVNNIVISAAKQNGKTAELIRTVVYDTLYSPSIQLEIPPVLAGTKFSTKSPTFIGIITSPTIGVSIIKSELIINGIKYNLDLDGNGRFSRAVELPSDGNYTFTITANNSEGYSRVEEGFITIDTAGPSGCITVGGITHCGSFTTQSTPTIPGTNCGDKICDYNENCIDDCILDVNGYVIAGKLSMTGDNLKNMYQGYSVIPSARHTVYYSRGGKFFKLDIELFDSVQKANESIAEIISLSNPHVQILNSNKVYGDQYKAFWLSNNKIIGFNSGEELSTYPDLVNAYLNKYPSTIT